MTTRGTLFAAVVAVLAIAIAPPASASITITPYKASSSASPGGFSPSSAPNCYTAKQVYTGVATCFGATAMGGKIGYGTLIQVDPTGKKYTKIYDFDVVKGLMPSQAPILFSDGRTLIGTTSQGGVAGSGLVYAYNVENKTMQTLGAFTGPGGSTPQGPPIEVNGTIYGTAGQGGAYGYGVVWSVVPGSGNPMKVLHSFAGGKNDTATCFNALAYNPVDGLLYGVGFTAGANDMGGIFSLKLDGSGYALRASLTAQSGGATQMGALTVDKDGMIYSNAWKGGLNNSGTIFSFNPKTNAVTQIFSYNSLTGTQPYNGLALSPSGKWLYSVTWQGGQSGLGTVIAVAKNGTVSKVLLQANLAKTGGGSIANPTVSTDNKYIITQMSIGGKYGVGTLVSLEIPDEVL